TPATAWISPTVRRRNGERIGKPVCRSATDSSGAADSAAMAEHLLGVVAGGVVAGGPAGGGTERWGHLDARLRGERAAGVERAAGREVEEVRRRALDRREPLLTVEQVGHGGHEADAVGVGAVVVHLADGAGLD